MRNDKLNLGLIFRILMSLLPILFGMPILATIFCAYNIAMIYIVSGPTSALISSLSAVMFSMFISGSFGPKGEAEGLVIGLQAVLCAGGCIAGLLKKKNFYKGLTLATLGILTPQLIFLNSVAAKNGMSLAQMLVPPKEYLVNMLNHTINIPQEVKQQLSIGPETIEMIAQYAHDFTMVIIPAAFIITSMVLAYIVMWVVAAPLRKKTGEKVHSFAQLKLPRIATVIIAVFSVLLLGGFTDPFSTIGMIVINMLFVLLAMALFSGISFWDSLLRKALPIRFLRVIIHVIISTNFSFLYMLVGLIDSFANFRKLSKDADKKGGGDYEAEK